MMVPMYLLYEVGLVPVVGFCRRKRGFGEVLLA